MSKSSKVVALALLGALMVPTLALANPGKAPANPGNDRGNSASSNKPAPAVAEAPNTQAAEKRAEQASSVAEEKKQEATQVVEKKEQVQAEAAQAEAAKREAERELAKVEQEAKNAPATSEVKEKLDEIKSKAAEAAQEAKEKQQEVAKVEKEAANVQAEAKKATAAAKALSKIKGASEECLDYVENGTSKAKADCSLSRYVIRFNSGVDPDLQVRGMRAIKIPVVATLRAAFPGAVADLNAGQLKSLVASGKIQSVEQDFQIRLQSTQNGPTWGLDRIDQPALPLSGTYTNARQGAGVRVYVVDTGVLASHVDFAGRVISGYSAIADGQGTTDCNGHGTHVAATAAGTTYGVAKQAQIVPVRVLDCSGSGFLSGVVSGIDWIGQNHPVGSPAVVNMSLGGGASSTLDAAVESLVSKGIVTVVAAGNSSADACSSSPARTPNAITVAASSNTDGFASFSNFGSCVDLIAPGVGVLSAWYTSTTATQTLNGTSMATPHVAGVVASIQSDGYLSPSQADFLLKSNAVKQVVTGLPSGTANALLQLGATSLPPTAPPTESVSVPVAPVLIASVFDRNSARVRWDISPDGGSALTGNIVRVWERGQLTKAIEVSATATSHRVTGLKWDVSYTFTIVAVNPIGRSADSNVSTAFTPTRR